MCQSKLVTVALTLSLLVASGGGCACPTLPAPPPTPAPPKPAPSPAEPAIPSHFTSYTDEAGLFSISYPPDWELALSEIEGVEQRTKELVKGMEFDFPLESASLIFFTGMPTKTGYNPACNIVVQSFPGVGWTQDKTVEAAILGIKNNIEGYHEFSRVKTTIGGREATIVDWQGDYPSIGTLRSLQVYMLVGKFGWLVNCTTTPDKYSDFEDDFNAIVRSLRILK